MTLLSRCHLGNVGSSKEKRIWVIRGREIKAKRNSRKRPSLVRRTNEKRRKKRRTNRCPVPSGDAMPLGTAVSSMDYWSLTSCCILVGVKDPSKGAMNHA